MAINRTTLFLFLSLLVNIFVLLICFFYLISYGVVKETYLLMPSDAACIDTQNYTPAQLSIKTRKNKT